MWIIVQFLALMVAGLRFDIHSSAGEGTQRCFEQYIPKETTLTGRVEIPAKPNQRVDFKISDDSEHQSIYFTKDKVEGSSKFSFTVHVDANVRFCFTALLLNSLELRLTLEHAPGPDVYRSVFLHVESGHANEPDKAGLPSSKYETFDNELNWLKTLSEDALTLIMKYEEDDRKMQQTNLETKERVFNLSSFSIIVLMILGIWEVWYESC